MEPIKEQTHKLINDVISNFNKQIKGKRGDKVKIIADHFPSVIVEDINGNRYSTKHENLTEI